MAEVVLQTEGPFDAEAALALQLAHTIVGCERTDAATGWHERLLRIRGDRTGGSGSREAAAGSPVVAIRVRLADPVQLECPESELEWVVPVVRRWLDLDADQAVRNARFADDPLIGPLVKRRPGLRVVGHPDPFEALVNTVVGQQISLAAARTMTARLVARFGEPGPAGLVAFPTPQRLAATSSDELRGCGFMAARVRTLLAVSQAVADGLDLAPDPEELPRTRAELLALPGVGPWTVGFLALRALGDPDSFPSGDLVLQRALGVATAAQASAVAQRWRPERSFAALHLWTAAAYLP